MIPDDKQIDDLLLKYSTTPNKLELIRTHGLIVAEIALEVAERLKLDVDLKMLHSASRIHDIGSFLLMDDNGDIDTDYYQLHGLVGSKILQEEGVDAKICEMLETHQFLILEPKARQKVLNRKPNKSYSPKNVEADLLCYADRFHSKRPVFNSIDFLTSQLANAPTLQPMFNEWLEKYGTPDINTLALKYNHPIR